MEIFFNNNWAGSPPRFLMAIWPPFGSHAWFWFILGIVLAGVGFLIVRWIFLRKYEAKPKQIEIEQKIQEERERISSDLHDNIVSNMTSIVTGLEIAKKYLEHKENKKAESNIDLIEKHARDTIDLLRQAIWSLQSDVKTCGALIEKVRDLIHMQAKFCTKPKIKLISNVNEDTVLAPFVSLNLFRIIQEAVSNAVKYACNKEVNIVFTNLSANKLQVEIIDRGHGFDYDQNNCSGRGFGLSNMQRRAEKIGAELSISSEKGKGTRVSIVLEM